MQLYTWKYNEQDEFGYELSNRSHYFSLRFARIDSGTSGFMRDTRFITDFRPAKVVDADAVVIDKAQLTILRLAVKEGIEGIDSWRTKTYPQPDESVKARGVLAAISQIVNGFSIPLTPPVTEPKGFGAIVEASLGSLSGRIKEKWVLTGTGWVCLPHGCKKDWSELINPAVISEGQK